MADQNQKYSTDAFNGLSLDAKLREVAAASQAKIAELDNRRQASAEAEALANFDALQNRDSWVNAIGVPTDSAAGIAANLSSSLFYGLGRGVGHIGSLVSNKAAADMENNTPDAVIQAYNRFNKGEETQADVALLREKSNNVNELNPLNNLERMLQIERVRGYGRKVNDLFDFKNIVQQDNRNALNNSLDGAKDDLGILTDSEQSLWDRTKALGGVLKNAGAAAVDNKMAALEYITENVPQLALGGAGTKGMAALGASNLGYALDEYSKGMENRLKAGKDLPLQAERDELMARAASVALAEQAGDMLQIGVGKLLNRAGKTTAEAGMKGGFLGTLKAGTTGAVGEAATEGFQTYQEQILEGRDPSALETYKGAVIGGLSGGGMTGGMRALAEVTGATPEAANRQAERAAQAQVFRDAVEANDITAFVDPTSQQYNLAAAVGALHQMNLAETATPESRMENFNKAGEVLASLDARQTELQNVVKTGTPAEQKAANAELKKIALQVKDGQAVWNSMFDEINKEVLSVPVETQVQQANTSVENASPEVLEQSSNATDSIINLSMASINHLTPQQAEDLATNTENGLNDTQRSFLRAFSAARLAYNEAQTLKSANRGVMVGDDKNIGISQYRTRISTALTSNNKAKAESDLAMLNTFATSHTEKAAVAKAAFERYGEAGQVYKTDSGWGMAAPRTYDSAKLHQGGGLYVIKPKLLAALEAEAKAVAAVRDEMNQAVALKFGPVQTQNAPVQSAAPAAQIPTPTQNNQPQGNVEEEARLSVTPPESKPVAPPAKKEKVNHVGKEFATAKEADQYLYDNFIAENHKIVRKADKSGYTIESRKKAPVAAPVEQKVEPKPKKNVLSGLDTQARVDASMRGERILKPAPVAPSPESAPLAPVADAPVAQDTNSAALAENPETPIQQEATEQPASVSEATAAEVAPAVEAIAEKTSATTPYKKKKLGDFFQQKPNVLGRIKDFLSSVSTPDQAAAQIGVESLTSEQASGLRSFMAYAKGVTALINENLVKGNPEYNYADGMQHFIGADGKIEENVSTAIAYAVFSYVAENFGGKGYNTRADVNRLLGREKDAPVTAAEYATFGDLMASTPKMVEVLGQRITQALGLEAFKTTPENELPRLQASLGAHAVHLMVSGKSPFMVMESVKPEVMTAARGRSNDITSAGVTTAAQEESFLRVNRDKDRAPVKEVEDILNSMKGTQGIVNNLFSLEAAERPPTFEPVTKLRKYAKRTQQAVPAFLNQVIKKLNSQKNYLRLDKLQISQVLGDERFLTAMGVTKVDDGVHEANRKPAEARNDGLRREFDNMKEFVKSYLGEDLTKPFYFEHYAMKQQRVGIANSLVNPQLSKIHRFMVYRNSWITEVDMADRDSLENFVLRAAEGLGIKTEQKERSTSMLEFKALYNSPEIQAGIAALNKIEAGQDLTDAEKDAVVKAVGGHAAHGLDALVALAAYNRAQVGKKTKFKVNMLAEVDGVTNGPMLSHLLMGAAGSVSNLFDMLNRGGFYQTEGMQFNDWRSSNGHQDLYETTTRNTLNTLDVLVRNGDVQQGALADVMAFMGKLTDPKTGVVLKAGRNMIKTPLTAMVYGSGIKTAIEGMAYDFIANIYKQMETAYALRDTDAAASKKMHEATVTALRNMGIDIPANVGVSEIMDLVFDKSDENLLVGTFMSTLGMAVEETIRQDFKHLLDARQRFNSVASMTFDMYNAAYEGLRNQLIAELVKSGDIASTTMGNEIHELNSQQQAILDERMSKITPVLQTAMSNLSGEATANTGMLVSSTELGVDTSLSYKSITKFAKGFKFGAGGTKSLINYARRMRNSDPGVGLGATSTHSFDSAVAHSAIADAIKAGMEILNLHDAGGTGINDLVEQGRRMNKAVWDRAINWSPSTEMYESYMRTIRGMQALLADTNTPQEVKEMLAKSIVAQSKKFAGKNLDGSKRKQPSPATMLMARALEAKRLAFETNSIKLAAMAEMHTIAQYAVEGGQYDVTEANRKEALDRLNKETASMPDADIDAVKAVNDALQDYIVGAMQEADTADKAKKAGVKAPKTSDIGTLGKPAVASDVKLVNFFRSKPNRTVAEVAAFLKTQNLNGFQDKLLSALVKSLGARSASYTVNFLTKTSELKDVLEPANGPSHAWFVSKDGKNAIYLLSPDFKESGLTVETLLHEMTHAAVAHAIANPTPETRALVDELEKIRQKAEQVIYEGKMPQFAAAVESVQELVAYGMTNPEFQAILDSFAFTSNTRDNKWVSGLWAFIDTLVGLVFGRQNDAASTGMTSLITNVSGLMAASAKSQASTANINQSMAAGTPALASLRGEEMYDALATLGTTRVSAQFDGHLRAILDLMEKSVHSPLSALKQAALDAAAQTPVEMWDKMKTKGLVAFANSALGSGFHFTEQEAFAMQQVEATVRTALTSRDGSTTAVYRELARLYNETRESLKGRIAEFHPNANQAQKLYDFVFKMEPGMGDMSDYLSRFAALGLTNAEFANLLGFRTEVNDTPLSGLTFSEKLNAIFERILAFINAKATNTFGGQKADEKLLSLVNQLVDIEQRKRMKLSQSASVAMDSFEKVFRDGFDAARRGAAAVGAADFFRKNTNGVMRLTGRVVSIVATERVEEYLNSLQTFRDATMRDRLGIMMGLVNETRGAHALNAMFYKLSRLTKHTEGIRKEIITNTNTFVRESFKEEGEYLTEKMKKALSYTILRADVASLLDHFDMKGIRELFDDPAALSNAIAQFESKLAGFAHAQSYKNGAKALGLYLATNEVGAENLRLNADNIAAMLGTEHAGKVAADVVEQAALVIDPLASLYALRDMDAAYMAGVKEVFSVEGTRTEGNGIEMLLKLHKDLQQQSKDRLFQGAGTLRMKGYTPEVYNPYIRLEVAKNAAEGMKLIEHGYDAGSLLTQDQADPDANGETRIYSLRDGGMVQYLTGIFSYTGQNKRGSATHNGDMGLLSENGLMNRAKMTKIANAQAAGIRQQATRDIVPKDNAKRSNYLVPVFNAVGDVVNYRYMMNAATKDGLLERTNDFDQLMGVMAGSIYDKETTVKQNETAVQALYDQYKQDFGMNPGSYLQVGPNSPDAEAREVWRLLPEATKQSVRAIWGTNAMMVRFDVLDINFGYRKKSAATPFGIPEDQRDAFQQAYVGLLEGLMGKKAGLYVRRVEDGWQALVREAKDTLVVKSGMTLLGNFTSNITALIWFGVPVTDIWHHHRVAMKGITAYRKDSKKLDSLEQAMRLNQLNGRDRNEIKREIVQLKDALARNPVSELVDAGMMPTIVEDVSLDDDKYSYKGQLVGAIDDFVGNLNPQVLKVGKVLAMAHDTPLYKALSYGTQVSDFVARYTLYQHVKTRTKNPLTGDKALQLVSDAFVNYDVPSHRDVQYANDMGLVYFTKYYLRIQKVIAMLYRDSPGRAMMLLTLGHFMDFIPMLTHSQMLERVGNPFSTGAFEALTSLDEMLTIQTLTSPFR